jgi:murein DD-endopeptidase MepM/ murein hydrolase activator NlpD
VLEQQVALLQDEITNVNTQIASYSLLIADKQDELEEAQLRLADLTNQHRKRLRAMEEQGQLSYWAVIFKANSFSDLLDRVTMVKEIAAADRYRLTQMNEAAQQVVETQKELEQEKLELENTRAELEASQQALDEKNAEADALLSELADVCEDMNALHNQFEAEEDSFLEQIAIKDKEYNDKLAEEREISRQASIQASIQESIQESIQISVQESIEASIQAAKPSKPTTSTSGGSGGGNSSSKKWLKPTAYSYVSSPFGYRVHPVTGKWTMHKGVDLVASKGTPIYASRSGYVTIATYHSTAGNYVTLNHQDGYTSVYMHMTHDVVSVGEYVKAGELIGYVGSTGRSTGPHLHFGITYNGTYVNPMNYI